MSLVKNINDSVGDSIPGEIVAVGGLKVFGATNVSSGRELWRTDGTGLGTQLLVDLNPNPQEWVSDPLMLPNGKAVFLASGTGGNRPYVTDGTALGTVQLAPIVGVQGNYVVAGNLAYFGTANQLWRTDGTVAGTFPVAATSFFVVSPGASFAVSGTSAYFVGTDNEVWFTDGTVDGTHQFIDIQPGVPSYARMFLPQSDGSVLFWAEDGIHGKELWRSDGTDIGTSLVRDITPGSGSVGGYFMFQLGGGRAVFDIGPALWSTNGTEAGTTPIKASFVPQSLGFLGGKMYFSENGQLWMTDGTAAGTKLVPGTPTGVSQIQVAGNTVFFAGTDAAGGKELWGATNGVATRIKDIFVGEIGSQVRLESAIGNRMYFRATDGDGSPQLWQSDGTSAGTFPITVGGSPGIGQTAVPLFREANGTVYLRADDGTLGSELWSATPDAPSTFSIADASVNEGSNGTTSLVLTVSRTNSAGYAAVNWSTANGNVAGAIAQAGSDYTASTGTVFFAPGQLTRQLFMNVVGDTAVESNESFFVNLSSFYSATFADSQAVATIVNDDQAVTVAGLSVNDVSITEGAGATTKNLAFTVSLSKKVAKAVTFSYATQGNTAASGTDFVAKTGTATIAANALSVVVNVVIKGDAVYEPDETFYLKLSNAVNATILDNTGIGKIVNDELIPKLNIFDAPSIIEGNSGTRQLVYTVKLDKASSTAVTVNFATADGTAKVASNDYKALSGKLTFAAGETSKTIIVTTVGDTRKGVDETVFVKLSSAIGAQIVDGQAVGTIKNDD
ncbi:Calx-beta domain-containing protein [Humisphaera borealis]|uniref:Calx-beta domain-containing protein n=1 Tax=Humisphaera borealis TaxID=2807512 RepID=A0A7M2WXF3_9BACT|nr:Calx-beta domain-containing protein [Humisphaera borealis]QOV90034.1 hypothetical protein IPV69_01275 [Humisphaera borealis]